MHQIQMREPLEGVLANGGAVFLAVLAEIDHAETPFVTTGDRESRLVPARSLVRLSPKQIGCQVALLYEGGDRSRPIVVGVIQGAPCESGDDLAVEIDGHSIVLEGKRHIVLRCGKASITLTREGKIIVRGSYLVSRSSGVNKIKGGSVQIN